jgi:hypothetical protein
MDSEQQSYINDFSDIEDDEEEIIVEDCDGWHIDNEGNQFCMGCESGTDCIGSHCTACNDERGV